MSEYVAPELENGEVIINGYVIGAQTELRGKARTIVSATGPTITTGTRVTTNGAIRAGFCYHWTYAAASGR